MFAIERNGLAKHRMLSGLTRTGRWKAGWCVALAYLFCVLAPSLSFAFGDGSLSAPCLVEDHGPGMNTGDETMASHVMASHAHMASHAYETGLHHDHSHDLAGAADEHQDDGSPIKGPHRHGDQRCCGLVTLSAIAADEIVLFEPATPSSRCAISRCQAVADNAPPRLYRPPIV